MEFLIRCVPVYSAHVYKMFYQQSFIRVQGESSLMLSYSD